MILAVQGSRKFDDYSIFLSAMGRAMRRLEDGDREIFLYTAGPRRINEMALEFVNVSDFKSRQIKAQVRKVPPSWIEDNMSYLDYFAYFCVDRESVPPIVDLADSKDVPADVYRFKNAA
jgi:hypothetical protein